MSKTSDTSYGAAATNAQSNEQTRELTADDELGVISGGIKRSLPNGRTDVIKAMGNTKWGDIELHSGTP
jgi:hypothetical protein